MSALLVGGCASFAYTNSDLRSKPGTGPTKASFSIQPRETKRQDRVLVLLALSGGGSRAAYLSAQTMLALSHVSGSNGRTVDVLGEVDLISSVSGGSLAAAYYAASHDESRPPPNRTSFRRWSPEQVDRLFRKNYQSRWFANWFWPTNIAKFWFTAFDRTDIMAQTLADNLYDTLPAGIDMTLGELNPARPNLVINATIGSGSYDAHKGEDAKVFGTVFTFTDEDFRRKVASNINDYDLSRAVMASATFPGAFNFMTLRDFTENVPPNPIGNVAEHASGAAGKRYLHLFDGGNSDNLGLLSLTRVLLQDDAAALDRYERIVVVLVDAYRRSLGAPSSAHNPRPPFSYVIDSNFLDATDSLLEANRERLIKEYFSRSLTRHTRRASCYRDNLPDSACFADKPARRDAIEDRLNEKLYFLHVGFDSVKDQSLRDALNEIPTSFMLSDAQGDAIKRGVQEMFGPDAMPEMRQCLTLLADLISDPTLRPRPVLTNEFCGGGSEFEQEQRKLMRLPKL